MKYTNNRLVSDEVCYGVTTSGGLERPSDGGDAVHGDGRAEAATSKFVRSTPRRLGASPVPAFPAKRRWCQWRPDPGEQDNKVLQGRLGPTGQDDRVSTQRVLTDSCPSFLLAIILVTYLLFHY
jgi:hypothetical protein